MFEDFKDIYFPVFMTVIGILLIGASIAIPMAYFEGSAKSNYLKEYRGIEMPWYQSVFMSVEINDAKIKIEKD